MLRSRKGAIWADSLLSGDMKYLSGRIEPTEWYPMETFERMGLAILSEIAGDDVTLVELFGRASVDGLLRLYPMLLAPKDPRETIMRFQSLQRGFFDFPAFEIELTDGKATVRIDYQMSARAEEAACHQALGFFDRLLDLAGAVDRSVSFRARRWTGDGSTLLALTWK